MSTRGVYTFKGDGEAFHVYKHYDNYPTGAQEALAAVQQQGKAWELPRYEADEYAAGFVAANKTACGGVRLMTRRSGAADVAFGYTVEQKNGDLMLTVTSTDFWESRPKEKTLWRGKLEDFTPEVAATLEA